MSKSIHILSIFLTLFVSATWSQVDQDFVYWQKSIGAQGEDNLNDMVKDPVGNFYTVGSSQTAGSQSMDIIVSKFSPNGREIWSKTIGESGDERGIAIELMNDELFIIASSNSNAGYFEGNLGREDVYLLRMDSEGAILQSTHFGGNYADIPSDITKTANGELLIAAYSKSSEGMFDANRGQSDMWVIRSTVQGEVVWKQNYGGTDEDFSCKLRELPNGEIVFFGHSTSFDGDMMQNYGDLDLSLFKLSASGSILWEQNYGGLQSETASDLLLKNGNRIIVAANTQSLSFDISKNAGSSDAWVLEIDAANGGILWEETHGSEFGDYASGLALDANNQLFLMGTTNAPVFRGELSNGSEDSWLAKINDAEASIEHITLFGGAGFEQVSNFDIEADGSVLLIGTSNSRNELFSDNKGNSDGWLMKVTLNNLLDGNTTEAVSAHPNPSNGTVYLNHLEGADEITVYSASGKIVVERFQATSFSQVLDLQHVSPGMYLVSIERSSGTELIRLVRK